MPSSLFVPEDGTTTLEGTLERVVYTSSDTGWTVARLEAPVDPVKSAGVRAVPPGEPVTIVGNLAGVQPGESLRLTGRWIDDRRYGRQFRVDSFLSIQPSTLVGIEKYLGSGLVRGIGPVMAHKLVEHFGIATLRVIDEEAARPERGAGARAVAHRRDPGRLA